MVVRYTPGDKYLTLSRPLKVGSAACLTCHSTPDAAPPTMVALYGSQNGFGWKQGETIGAQVESSRWPCRCSGPTARWAGLMVALGGVF